MKLEYHHCVTISNNWHRQESPVEATTWKFDEEQDIYINWKHLSRNYLLATKGKLVILQWVNLVNTTITLNQLTIPTKRQTDLMCLLIRCPEKDSVSFLRCVCQNCLNLMVKEPSCKPNSRPFDRITGL